MYGNDERRQSMNLSYSENQTYQLNSSKQPIRFHESPKRKPIFGYRSMIPTNRISESDLPKQTEEFRDKQYKGPNSDIAEGLERMIDILQIKFKEMEKLEEENWVLRRENNEMRERQKAWVKEEEQKRMLEETNVDYKRKIFEARKQLEQLSKRSNIPGLQPILSSLNF